MKIKSIPLSLSLLIAAGVAHGSLINFDSASGFSTGSLNGQNGWAVSIPGDANVVSGGLSYSGGSLVHSGGDQKLALTGGSEARASIGLPSTYAPGSTFYFSFLFEHDSGDNFLWFAFADGADNDNNSVAALAQNAPVAGVAQPRLRTRVRDTANTSNNGIAGVHDLGNNTTRLVVGEVFFGGDTANTTITVWLDPTSTLQGEAANAQFNAGRNIGITELNTLWIRKGANAGTAFVDHIMIGDSWDAVVIPEPATYAAFFGLAALGLIVWRRRRN
ncbi:MAG: PEP-CTERM sorting domain-containing protein [Opitutales bacterium]|nr:PEP-CTERM sorting domain-containing protein [Opitutales bacterium]